MNKFENLNKGNRFFLHQPHPGLLVPNVFKKRPRGVTQMVCRTVLYKLERSIPQTLIYKIKYDSANEIGASLSGALTFLYME